MQKNIKHNNILNKGFVKFGKDYKYRSFFIMLKLTESLRIVDTIVQWQLVHMGIINRHELNQKDLADLSSYSLEELLFANKEFERWKKKQAGNGFLRKKNKPVDNPDIFIDERLIAAIYVILHFPAGDESVALINDKLCGVVEAEYK